MTAALILLLCGGGMGLAMWLEERGYRARTKNQHDRLARWN